VVTSREVKLRREWNATNAAAVILKEMLKRLVEKHLKMQNPGSRNTVGKMRALDGENYFLY